MQDIEDEITLKPEAGRQLFDHSILSSDQHRNAAQPVQTFPLMVLAPYH